MGLHIHMETSKVLSQEIDQEQQMELILVQMKVLNQASGMGNCFIQHLVLWMESHLVHKILQRYNTQKAPLMGLNMTTLRVCCWELDLEQQMELSLLPTKVLNQFSRVENNLLKDLLLWKESYLIHMLVHCQDHKNDTLMGLYMERFEGSQLEY